MAQTIKDVLGKISKSSGFGDISRVAIENLRGINHRGFGNAIPANKDNFGLTFFTRPNLNLSYDNISASRIFSPLLDGEGPAANTYQRALRMLLDPYLGDSSRYTYGDVTTASKMLRCDLIDQKNAFIPILTNNLISLSGWPDISADTYTSAAGNFREAWSMIDSSTRICEPFELSATFRNIEGDPITTLFSIWVNYASQVYLGDMVPYPDNLVERRKDYETRIYRLILDPNRRYVQKIGATIAAFPMNSPIGAAMNFSNDAVYNNENDQISIRFQCQGADYLDPITIEEFNGVVQLFNPDMKGSDANRANFYFKASPEQLKFFNYRGYPRIDPDTNELQWWIPNEYQTDYTNRNSFGLSDLKPTSEYDVMAINDTGTVV